jgi:hypothetical protein
MSSALKILTWCFGILIILTGLVSWRNFFFYPKVWRARVTLDRSLCGECAVYVHRSRLGGVLVRRDHQTSELYSLAFPNSNSDVPNGAVWKCVDGAFSFTPGLAFHSLTQWCSPGGFAPAQKQVRMNIGLIEFTADDGKRVRAEW